jgi:nucleoside 2-deoxyribosyltransferase
MPDESKDYSSGWKYGSAPLHDTGAPLWVDRYGAPEPPAPAPARKLIYLAGSMRNREGILRVTKALEEAGYAVFHSWINPGEETDDKWMEWQRSLGRDYFEAMVDPHVANVHAFDITWLNKSDALVMLGPAGKSAHAELGYMFGRGKPTCVLMESEPERWDIMTDAFSQGIFRNVGEVLLWLSHAI